MKVLMINSWESVNWWVQISVVYNLHVSGDFYGRVVDRFVQQAIRGEPITVYGDGKQTRSFTYVTDTVAALLMLILKGNEGEVYNIGNDKEISILDLAYEVKRVCKSSSDGLCM